jgi:hypothetical protein
VIDSDTFYEMLENVQRGIDIKLAMSAFGVNRSDLEPWHKAEIKKAKAQATIAMQGIVRDHGAEDWRALQWLIEINNKDKDDEKQLREILNRQIAKELAKGLIESSAGEADTGDSGDSGTQSEESEDYSDSQRPRGVLRLPQNNIDSPADGNF